MRQTKQRTERLMERIEQCLLKTIDLLQVCLAKCIADLMSQKEMAQILTGLFLDTMDYFMYPHLGLPEGEASAANWLVVSLNPYMDSCGFLTTVRHF